MQPKLILADEKKRVSYLKTIIANFVLIPSSTLPLNCICCRMKKVLQFEFVENNMVYTFFLQKITIGFPHDISGT